VQTVPVGEIDAAIPAHEMFGYVVVVEGARVGEEVFAVFAPAVRVHGRVAAALE